MKLTAHDMAFLKKEEPPKRATRAPTKRIVGSQKGDRTTYKLADGEFTYSQVLDECKKKKLDMSVNTLRNRCVVGESEGRDLKWVTRPVRSRRPIIYKFANGDEHTIDQLFKMYLGLHGCEISSTGLHTRLKKGLARGELLMEDIMRPLQRRTTNED